MSTKKIPFILNDIRIETTGDAKLYGNIVISCSFIFTGSSSKESVSIGDYILKNPLDPMEYMQAQRNRIEQLEKFIDEYINAEMP